MGKSRSESEFGESEFGLARERKAHPTIGWLTQAEVNTLSVELWTGVEDAARERGANLLYVPGDTLNSPVGFRAQANVLYELVGAESLDGLLVWGGLLFQYISPEEFVAFCQQYHPLPVVNVGMPVEGIPSVWVDNYRGMQDVVRHLVEAHGCTRIAYIRGVDNPEGEDRYLAYADVLAEQGIALDPNLVTPHSDQQRADGAAAMRLLLDERKVDFEAVVAATDALALGAMDALQARRVSVPGEVRVVGFDDVEEARLITPPLTTVRQPFYEMAKQAAGMLLDLLAGEGANQNSSANQNSADRSPFADGMTLDTELVVRQSCGCLDAAIVEARAPSAAPGLEGHPPEERERTGVRSGSGMWQDTLAARREEIVSEMVATAGGGLESVGEPGFVREWAGKLLDSFAAELGGESPGLFSSTLDDALNQLIGAGGDVARWQGAITAFRRQALPALSGDGQVLLRGEDLWQQGRVAIARATERSRGHRALQVTQRAEMLQRIGQAVLTTASMSELAQVFVQELPRLGIPSCYLSLYENPESPTEWSRLILAYDEGRLVELEEGGLRFPSRRLIPEGVFRRREAEFEERRTLSLEPLYFRESQYGFALLELGPQQAEVRDILRLQLSSALQKRSLVQQMANRALQLQTAAEVSQAASSILEPDELVQQVVDLIRERFDLYYVGLFLVEADGSQDGGGWAVLRAGTGEAGRTMVEQGHRLEVGGRSMIGRCIADRQARIAADVRSAGAEIEHFDNPLLPDTRSEMALPLVSRAEILGALTVQSTQEAAFSDEDVTILRTMADQLANAIENARLYHQAQQEIAERARAEEALVQEQSLMTALMDGLPDAIYFKDLESRFLRINRSQSERFGLSDPVEAVGKTDFDFFTEEHARPAFEDEQRIIRTGEPVLDLEERETWPDRPDTWVATNKLPLYDEEGKIVGTYGISKDITLRKRVEEALKRRSTQLQAAAEVSRAASSILDLDELIGQVVNVVREHFDLYHVGLFLVEAGPEAVDTGPEAVEPSRWAVLRAATGKAGQQMVEQGHKLEVGGESMIGWSVAHNQTRLAMDVGEDPVRFDNPLLPKTRSELALPLISRGQAVGALTIQSSEEAAFSDEDIVVFETMASQIANALENARLLEQTQVALDEAEDQAHRLALLNGLSEHLARAESLDEILDISATRVPQIILADWASVALLTEAGESLEVLALQGEAGAVPLGTSLPVEGTAVGTVVRENRLVVTADTRTADLLDLVSLAQQGILSTMSVPLFVGGRVMATLNVGQERSKAYTQRDEGLLLQTATLLSSVIENRRLLEQANAALRELEAAQRRYMRLAWTDYVSARGAIQGYVRAGDGEGPTAEAWLPVMTAATGQQDTVIERDQEEGSVLAIPLTVGGEVIGVLGGHRTDAEGWQEDDIAAAEAIVEQMALALDGQRLYDEEQQARQLLDQRVKELDCLSDIGRQIDEAPEIPQFLEWVTERIPSAMQYPGLCVVAIELEDQVYGAPEARYLPCQIVQSLLIGGDPLGRVYIAYVEERDFLDEESALLGDVARRVGGYIENRRLFEETQAALTEVEATHRTYLRQAWQDYLRQREVQERSGFVYSRPRTDQLEGTTVVPDLWLPEMERALAEGKAASASDSSDDGERTGLAVPITVRGETIGVLGIEAPTGGRQWTQEEQALVEAISDQLAQTLESARLFADTQRRAERELRVREITDQVRSALDLEQLAQRAAEELARTLGASHVAVRLNPKASAKRQQGE